MNIIGKSVIRKEAPDKVTGKARYTDDFSSAGIYHARLVTSPFAHALIKSIDTREAEKVSGVRAILTGEGLPLTGEEITDRPPLAQGKVRHHGEAVCLVVAEKLDKAALAASLIKVDYEPLSAVNSPSQAYQAGAPLVHEHVEHYKRGQNVYPEPGTNIAHKTKIRKGDLSRGIGESAVFVEGRYSFGPSDHAAIETRSCTAEIRADGDVLITSSSQAPFMIKKLIGSYFDIEAGKIIVKTPLVGGAYGGKASVQWEFLAFIASRAVGGKRVKLRYMREEDILTAPCHIGLDATIRLGCTSEGILKSAEILYLFDGGAYADKSPDLCRAGAVDCTGPYHIEHIWCDSYCLYTNHPYPAPFRGFAHSEVLFAFERTMDLLAKKLGMDPLELRFKNAILPGHTTPTQVLVNKSNVGDVRGCIQRLKDIMEEEWEPNAGHDPRKVRAAGIACVWKNSTIDTNASSGVILTFNPDGSVNLMSGVVEIGTGTKTILAQMLAEKLRLPVEMIHVKMTVDTQTTPEHWKTVASRGTLMGGRAVMAAAEDAIRQIKEIASCALRVREEDLDIDSGRVFVKAEPEIGLSFKEVVYGYTYPNGNAIGGQIIGRGSYILRNMTNIDKETGAGRPGPEWAVGAQAVQVEFDTRDCTYRILKAISVVDIGRVLNERAARGQVMGAMSMGLSFAGRETFYFDEMGRVLNFQLRTYRPIRYGEQPKYVVEFVNTPHVEAPFGARGAGEHGLLGMPAALANALSIAAGVEMIHLPLIPELIWRTLQEGKR
ncbi:xanthine dehydrogenase family protein molybdopterin-binding subunit [Peribacillus kribbensis]|uniref:xanthine dehydrogenase family protein molybdopterin-binding subunit n=1 Tax=Peribacillus kribbensis TaxID=356658 RepID=UPI00041FEC92|nr:xanthine dehydrogenase family protein molybdopterin-binding subunit [Peribacillus kribbensis]